MPLLRIPVPRLRPPIRVIGARIDETRVPEVRQHRARQAVVGLRRQRAVVRRRRAWPGRRHAARAAIRAAPAAAATEAMSVNFRLASDGFSRRCCIARRSATAKAVALQTTFALTPQPIATPAAANSAQPQLSVSKRGVLLSWIERSGDLATLKFSERTATGWIAAANGRLGPRLVRELGRRALGVAPAVGRARRALAAEERGIDLRLRRAPLVFDRRRQDVVAVVYCRITTARRPSTASRRCSRSATASGWSGSMARSAMKPASGRPVTAGTAEAAR